MTFLCCDWLLYDKIYKKHTEIMYDFSNVFLQKCSINILGRVCDTLAVCFGVLCKQKQFAAKFDKGQKA